MSEPIVGPYLVFAGEDDYPGGGWSDFVGQASTYKDAQALAKRAGQWAEWVEIVDMRTGDWFEDPVDRAPDHKPWCNAGQKPCTCERRRGERRKEDRGYGARKRTAKYDMYLSRTSERRVIVWPERTEGEG